jgi:uncharacterized membrane protein YeaQ/YmgE (transglycosylase-associated protein family)
MLSLFWFLLVGLAAGLLARAIASGRQSMDLPPTLLLGMAGSVIGGFLLSLLAGGLRGRGVGPAELVGSVAGAVLALLVFNRLTAAVSRRRKPSAPPAPPAPPSRWWVRSTAAGRAARNGGADRP